MKIGELKNQLMNLIDSGNQIEVEKVERYLNLVKIYRELDKTLKKDGYMIEVRNGAQTFLKANSAIGEKVKINQALIKLGEFFDKKIEQSQNGQNGPSFLDPQKFL